MIRLALNATLFLYVFGVFIFSKVEGLSLATNVALICLLVALAVKGLKTRLAGLKYSLLILPVVFILFLSIFWSRYPIEALISFLSFLTASVGGMAVMLALVNGASSKSVFWATLLGSSYLVYSAWQEKALFMLSRVAGLAGNSNDLAITLIIAGIIISCKRINNSYWPKFYSLFLLIFSVYMTGSRKTLFVLALIPAFWLFQMASNRLTKERIKKIALASVSVGIFALSAGPFVWSSFTETSTYKRSIEGSAGLNLSANIRKKMIIDGIELWEKKPILGYGINQYRFETEHDTYSHNNYIELLVSGGLIAFFAFYGILVCLLFLARKTMGQGRYIVLFSLILLMTWDVAMVSFSGKHIWLLIALCSWLTFGKRAEENRKEVASPLRKALLVALKRHVLKKDVAIDVGTLL